jgi:hypothetical protein
MKGAMRLMPWYGTGSRVAILKPETGGGGFMSIEKQMDNWGLDYREKAPLAATKDMFLDKGGNVIEGKRYNHICIRFLELLLVYLLSIINLVP